MDAITLLRNDHQTVETLFKRFESAGSRAFVEKRKIVDRIIEELSIHAAIEELVFYPTTRSMVPATEDMALESLEEHHIVKWVLSELNGMNPHDERFDAKVTVLIENVRHHVDEEQDGYFPMVRNALTRTQLAELGDALAVAKQTAPTHPHPRAPGEPPMNVINAITGVVDRIADNVNGIAQGGVTAGQELIGRIVGKKQPVASPTGTMGTRKTAASTRKTIDTAIDGVERTARSAKSGATRAGTAVRSNTRATVAAAGNAASASATRAKGASTTARTSKAAAKRVGTTTKKAASKTSATARN